MIAPLFKTARKLLASDTDTAIHSIKKFSDDTEYLKALHHCEKMGRGRNKVLKEINQLLNPTLPPMSTAKPAKAAKKTSPTMTESAPASDSNILKLDPRKLKLAPELAAVPMMGSVLEHYRSNPKTTALRDELDAERQGSHQSMDEIGIIDPLKVTLSADGLGGKVWDGRHRLEWAMSRGKDSVPVIHVTEEVGHKLMEASVIGRRHWTKGQRAYLGVICHPEVAGVTAGRPKKSADSIGVSGAPDLAHRLGVSPDVVNQAVTLYKAFHAPGSKANSAEAIEAADLKAKYEMSIWAGAGLGAVIAGLGGGKATHGKDRNESGWASLDKPLGTMTRLGKQFDSWDEEEKAKAQRLMTTRFKTDFTPAFRLALSEALAAADDSMSTILG